MISIDDINRYSVIKAPKGFNLHDCLDQLFGQFDGDLTETKTTTNPDMVAQFIQNQLQMIDQVKALAIPLQDYQTGKSQVLNPVPEDFGSTDDQLVYLISNKYLSDLDVPIAMLGLLLSLAQASADQGHSLSLPGSQLWILTDLCEEQMIPGPDQIIPLDDCTIEQATHTA